PGSRDRCGRAADPGAFASVHGDHAADRGRCRGGQAAERANGRAGTVAGREPAATASIRTVREPTALASVASASCTMSYSAAVMSRPGTGSLTDSNAAVSGTDRLQSAG